MNMDIITLEDCEQQYELNHCTTILHNGRIEGFEIGEYSNLNTIYISHTQQP